MKSLFLLPLIWSLFNSQVTITIIDNNSGETLSGVIDSYSNKYSDFDGNLQINKGADVNLQLISYNDIIIKDIKKDTTIYLKN